MSETVRARLLQACMTVLMLIAVAFGMGLAAIGIWEMDTHEPACERTPTP